jgi:hypothetical protein
VAPGAAGAGNITAGQGLGAPDHPAETVTLWKIDFSVAGNNLNQATTSFIWLTAGG